MLLGACEDKIDDASDERVVRKARKEVGMLKGEGAHCEKTP